MIVNDDSVFPENGFSVGPATPLMRRADPLRPVSHAGIPVIAVPPETSAAVVPVPSSNAYAAIRATATSLEEDGQRADGGCGGPERHRHDRGNNDVVDLRSSGERLPPAVTHHTRSAGAEHKARP